MYCEICPDKKDHPYWSRQAFGQHTRSAQHRRLAKEKNERLLSLRDEKDKEAKRRRLEIEAALPEPAAELDAEAEAPQEHPGNHVVRINRLCAR